MTTATHRPELLSTPSESKLALQRRGKAAHVGSIDAEGCVDTSEKGVKAREREGGELGTPTPARWMATERIPQYRRASVERREARKAGAADIDRWTTNARNKSTLS